MNKNKEIKNGRKIFVVGGDTNYANWCQAEIVPTMEEANLVMLTGGSDCSGYLYNEPEHRTTHTYPERDKYEVKQYEKGIKLGKSFVTICRGAQLSCTMAGGKLVQNVSHPYYHKIELYNGKVIDSNSLHHQMQWPFSLPEDKYKILGFTRNLSPIHQGFINGKECEMDCPVEPEIVVYPEIKSIGYQMHYELLANDPRFEEAITEARNLLDLFMDDKILA